MAIDEQQPSMYHIVIAWLCIGVGSLQPFAIFTAHRPPLKKRVLSVFQLSRLREESLPWHLQLVKFYEHFERLSKGANRHWLSRPTGNR